MPKLVDIQYSFGGKRGLCIRIANIKLRIADNELRIRIRFIRKFVIPNPQSAFPTKPIRVHSDEAQGKKWRSSSRILLKSVAQRSSP
jgi:hypothetical protein